MLSKITKACKKLPHLVLKVVRMEAGLKVGTRLQACQFLILVHFVSFQLDSKLASGYLCSIPFFKCNFWGFFSFL
jgi:hypothetical protein